MNACVSRVICAEIGQDARDRTNNEGKTMSETKHDACCPPFNPSGWDEQEIVWREKLFLKDRVRSFLHIPLNFGAVMIRGMALIEKADAAADPMLVVSDENSLWGADVYLSVKRDVPGAVMARLSGAFLCKVFEGPYRNMSKWIAEMKDYVAAQNKPVEKLLFYYTTCPKCAKMSGKNYVVILAKVQ